ncbi:cytochrome C oxidase subunit IV family protein [endosymbiont of unidentified scaly snail isolate Monju]|uniref:cytochrome C oxidase subunit IV family protein n=1 Tax=endosymbiont of unidentified scaly snail isolate Monju TaxID=1248727 RepID=UPI000389276D|nr:cytochrome C oxidase subunit IV family protein [endosymbiont of unidentified scaly snail isolate Monju]BAN69452.1 conserved hypothetical protein [endosymbiont of unidentified scaly snail isolate Monju]
MNTDSRNRGGSCTLIYIALMLLTLITWVVGKLGLQGLPVTLSVLALTVFKGQLIGDWFMGLRNVRGFWRWAILIWLAGVGVLVGVAFFLSSGLH